MDTIIASVETEIQNLQQRGLLKFIYNDEQELKLYDNPLFLDILKVHGERSRIHSFLLNERDFHFIIYYDDEGNQKNIRLMWPHDKGLRELAGLM